MKEYISKNRDMRVRSGTNLHDQTKFVVRDIVFSRVFLEVEKRMIKFIIKHDMKGGL